MNKRLHRAIMTGLGIAALAGVSTQASAQDTFAAGTLNVGDTYTHSKAVANYAWDGNNAGGAAKNLGWGHNTKFYTFALGVAAKVTVDVVDAATTANYFNPAFTLWETAGYTNPADVNQDGHTYSQVSTYSNGWLTDPAEGGVTSFIGYANSGPAFTNGASLPVLQGGSGGIVTVNAGTQAKLQIGSLASGQYLLAVGGSNNLGGHPGSGTYNLSISVAAVPEPEEYLMMLLGAGMVGFQVKRKKAKLAAEA